MGKKYHRRSRGMEAGAKACEGDGQQRKYEREWGRGGRGNGAYARGWLIIRSKTVCCQVWQGDGGDRAGGGRRGSYQRHCRCRLCDDNHLLNLRVGSVVAAAFAAAITIGRSCTLSLREWLVPAAWHAYVWEEAGAIPQFSPVQPFQPTKSIQSVTGTDQPCSRLLVKMGYGHVS